MVLIVFVLLLPVVVILAGTWAWRYQLRVLALFQRAADDETRLPEVRLTDVTITDADRVDLVLEHPNDASSERFAVAIDVPSLALSTLRRWHDGRARLLLIVPAGRNIVRLRRLDGLEALTLRRFAD